MLLSTNDTLCHCVTIVSLRNRTAERRGRQSAHVWQTWQGYYSCVLLWSSFNIMFASLLQTYLFQEKWSWAESLFKQNYCHACHTRFTVFFPLPSCCVNSLMTVDGLWCCVSTKRTPAQETRTIAPTKLLTGPSEREWRQLFLLRCFTLYFLSFCVVAS